MDHQPWKRHGKCVKLTPSEADELFFFDRGKSANPARKFCSGCKVKTLCLAYALFYEEQGVWAGTTEQDRQSLKPIISPILRQEFIDVEVFIEIRGNDNFIVFPTVTVNIEVTDDEFDELGWDYEGFSSSSTIMLNNVPA